MWFLQSSSFLSNCIEFLLGKQTDEDLINVGTGEEISILDLAKLIKDVIGFSGEIINDLNMPDGNPRKLLDSTKLISKGWKPRIGLSEGLSSVYEWYLQNKI